MINADELVIGYEEEFEFIINEKQLILIYNKTQDRWFLSHFDEDRYPDAIIFDFIEDDIIIFGVEFTKKEFEKYKEIALNETFD